MTFTVWDAAAIGNASLQNLTMQNAILWQILNAVNKIICVKYKYGIIFAQSCVF